MRQLLGVPKILLKRADRSGCPPLQTASLKGHPGVVELLLRAAWVNVNLVDEDD